MALASGRLKTGIAKMSSDRLKLLIWGNTFPRMGGVERFVDHVAHGLTNRGHEVVVLSDGEKIDTLTDRPFRVETVPMGDPVLSSDVAQVLTSARHIKRVISEFGPDVLHYNSSAVEMPIFVMSAMRTQVPIVSTLHFDLNNPVLVPVDSTFAKIMNASTRVTSISRYVHSVVPRVGSLKDRHVDLIENASPMAAPYRKPTGDKTILCIGRIVHDKGFDQMIAALPGVLEIHPEAHLVIAGLGPEMATLEAQIAQAGLGDHVSFIGWVQPEDVHAKMQEAAMIVFPSRWKEPFGLVAIEAALAGRPCVAFRVGGITDSIDPGVTGELAEPGDITELSAKINALLSDPKRAKAQGINAHKRHGDGANYEDMLDRYETLFHEVEGGARQTV